MDLSLQMFADIPKVVSFHYRQGNLNYPMVIFLSLAHVMGLVGSWFSFRCSAQTIAWGFFLGLSSGFGVTVGAHRLWAHRSYEACFAVRLVLMLLFSVANQGSIYHWTRDHRVHHRHSETDGDPHNATRGFFFAHMGWLLIKKHPKVHQAGKLMDFSDLEEDVLVMFQKKLDPFFNLYMCFIMPAQVASYFWGEDFLTTVLVAGAFRYILSLHATWLVNSAAHLMGDHPYDTASYPSENPLVSLASGGEGWHNWHHKYPHDYATSEFGCSAQYNPSKLVIDILAFFGLVWSRKRCTDAWAIGMQRRDKDRANGVPLPRVPPRPWETNM